jgi:hypothetical protein
MFSKVQYSSIAPLKFRVFLLYAMCTELVEESLISIGIDMSILKFESRVDEDNSMFSW